MALKTSLLLNLVGPTGPASVVTVTAPPGPNVGVVGGYAFWPPTSGASGNGNVFLAYGPKTASGWTQTAPDAQGNQYPVSYQLTGVAGSPGTAGSPGSNGLSVLFGAGPPSSAQAVVGTPGYIDTTAQAIYPPVTTAGVWGSPTPLYATVLRQTSGVPANTVGNNGDYAIDAFQGFLYGPKAAGAWSSTPLLSLVGPPGPRGAAGPATPLPQDFTANSFVVVPVSGSANNSVISQKSSAGAQLFLADTAGNVSTPGTLKATGAATLAATSVTGLTNTGNESVAGTLNVGGASTLKALQADSVISNNNAQVGGTLAVTGATTLAALSATTVAASGTSTLAAVSATNVSASGTLSASGATTLAALSATSVNNTGNESVGGTLSVVGASSVAALTSSALVTAKNLTLTSGGGGVLTFADGTTMATAASGTGGGSSSSGGSGSGLDTIYMGLHSAANGNYPTAYTANNGYFVNTQLQGTTTLTTGSAYVSPYAGTVYSIEVFAVSASNPISVNLYKNGVATSLVATSTTSGGGFYALTSAGSPITVAAGDLLQLFIKGTTASMTNSCIGWCTVQPTGGVAGTSPIVDMGYYWPGSGAYPTAMTPNALTITNSNTVATTSKYVAAGGNGTVVGLQGYVYGASGGKAYTWTLYKNGVATALTVSGTATSTTSGTPFTSTNASVTYVAGDILQVWSSAVSGATSQATSATITLSAGSGGSSSGTTTSGSTGASLDMGTYWNAAVPSSATPFIRTIFQSGQNPSTQTMNAHVTMPVAGTVRKITCQPNGTTSGTISVTLYKNGSATGVVATLPPTTVSTIAQLSGFTADAGNLSFVAGDTFQLYISNSGSTTNQAFSGTMTVAYSG